MAFLANLVGAQNVERFVPLADPLLENPGVFPAPAEGMAERDAPADVAVPAVPADVAVPPVPTDAAATAADVAAAVAAPALTSAAFDELEAMPPPQPADAIDTWRAVADVAALDSAAAAATTGVAAQADSSSMPEPDTDQAASQAGGFAIDLPAANDASACGVAGTPPEPAHGVTD
jgi:hypothetical protein